MKLSLVLVTYRSLGHVEAALGSFRFEAARAGLELETIVVDHSEDDVQAEGLAALGADRLLLRPNRGYAAGVNRGLEVASGELVAIANPDVELDVGALEPLVGALGEGFAAVGPQFELAGHHFPPPEDRRFRAAWRRLLVRWVPGLARQRFGAELARCFRVWEATDPVPVPELSGALLLATRATLERHGPWDEEYFLYFEESEWLRRVRRAGGRLAIVPRARVRHHWGHATGGAAGAVYESSRRRYWRHRPAGRLLLLLDRLAPAPRPLALSTGRCRPSAELSWLASPSPTGLPAALQRGDGDPEGAARRLAAEVGVTTDWLLVGWDRKRARVGWCQRL